MSEHPLWSSFVWRNELADTFVEMVAAPWFARGAAGTASLTLWLRSLGAGIGRGVWCETYWLPEADLVALGAGASVNRGCVLQTHLFHDRIMSMDTVTLGPGATLGPHGVILPGRVHRGARHGRAGLAGAARGRRTRRHPLDRQPDRALGHARLGAGMTGSPSRACSPQVDAGAVDPYLPGHGNAGYTVSRYELDLDYRVASNRLAARARLHATATGDCDRFSLDLAGLRVGKVMVNGRRAARYTQRSRQAARLAGVGGGRGRRARRGRAVLGPAAAAGRHVGRGGLGGAHRRRDRRGTA